MVIERGSNPYHYEVQGKANEPITVAALLDRARKELKPRSPKIELAEIVDRLDYNAPRIAIIGGSPDHPAHLMDYQTAFRAAHRIWQQGGVPFWFSVPVLCDGTAQSNIGMCYSLASRNEMAAMVVNQMEAQSYHGAFVLQGCDKQPLAVVAGLALLDVLRQRRGDAPVFASFAPAHVLRGGTIPDNLRQELLDLAARADAQGEKAIGDDLRDTLNYILQCSSNQAFLGVLTRTVQRGLLSQEQHKALEKRLAANTCHEAGGICAFNGTGNSSRHCVAALGLVHPALELLTAPPDQERVNAAVDALFTFCNNPDYSVFHMVAKNFANCVRVHSTTGGSTNLVKHLVAAMIYAGYDFSLFDLERIHTSTPIPDLFDYSLTQGRDIFALAQQCCDGKIRGMETVLFELMQNGVPVDLDAPTVTGTTWRQRLADTTNLSALGVSNNPIILARPRRSISGVDVLRSNFFESAVVKISGMPDPQVNEFDEKAAFVLYYENEDDANSGLLDTKLLQALPQRWDVTRHELLAMFSHNCTPEDLPLEQARALGDAELYQLMVQRRILKLAIVISGQGPEAFGMPEMFTPSQYLNSNRELRRLAVLISDGRYSGVSYGASIGHVTPEARRRGGILYLRTGDLLHLRLRAKRLNLLDRPAFRLGRLALYSGALEQDHAALGQERLERIEKRRSLIAPTNLMDDVTDAAHGVVPRVVARHATRPYVFPESVLWPQNVLDVLDPKEC
ncbi:MAG: dihydroxy-acid dehydratase [Deinococcus sp.]|nr:dihydroxy-acid dehydratase [Deinococcus sp.]